MLGTEQGLPEAALLLLFPAHLDSACVEVAVLTNVGIVMGGVAERW